LQDKRQETWDTASWQVLCPEDIPRQTNGCDCGVFSLLFCNRLGLGQPFDFAQVGWVLVLATCVHV
jgi:Ulp1 family protease